jgi:hypothetical protein
VVQPGRRGSRHRRLHLHLSLFLEVARSESANESASLQELKTSNGCTGLLEEAAGI